MAGDNENGGKHGRVDVGDSLSHGLLKLPPGVGRAVLGFLQQLMSDDVKGAALATLDDGDASEGIVDIPVLKRRGVDVGEIYTLLNSMVERFDRNNLLVRPDPAELDAVGALQNDVEPEVKALTSRLAHDFVTSSLANSKSRAGNNCFLGARLDSIVSCEEFSCLLLVLRRLGLFDDGEVHLNDICSGEGLSSFITAIVRRKREVKGRLTASLYDSDQLHAGTVGIMSKVFNSPTTGFKFNHCDATRAPIFTRQGVKNSWLLKYPEDASRPLLDRIVRLPSAELPDAIGYMPCSCHAYRLEAYPGDEATCLIAPGEWEKLSVFLMGLLSTGVRGSQLHDLVNQARVLMNAGVASYLNAKNPHIQAKVVVLPFGDLVDFYIDIRKRA